MKVQTDIRAGAYPTALNDDMTLDECEQDLDNNCPAFGQINGPVGFPGPFAFPMNTFPPSA